MKLTIEAEPKEIAALVAALQGRAMGEARTKGYSNNQKEMFTAYFLNHPDTPLIHDDRFLNCVLECLQSQKQCIGSV